MYDLADYGAMLAHRARTGAYAKAIERAVKPGSTAVEIGCGPGFFSLSACRAGARRVYAIESSESVAFARELVAANGCEDRIEVLQGSSRDLQLPERVDVIISDIRGTLPFLGDSIASIEDARIRFLAPGGTIIPREDRLYAALACAPEYYAGLVSPWRQTDSRVCLTPLIERALNSVYSVSFDAEKVISEPADWCHLDYSTGAPMRAAAEILLLPAHDGVAHGVCLWFKTILLEDIGYSTEPGQPDNVYGQLFLPWSEPVDLRAGDQVRLKLHVDPIQGSYVWRWESHFAGAASEAERVFSQSSFDSAPFSPQALRRRSAGFLPKLSEAAAAESWVMQNMDGTRSVQEIAADAARRFPGVFRNSQEAFDAVSRLAGRFAL